MGKNKQKNILSKLFLTNPFGLVYLILSILIIVICFVVGVSIAKYGLFPYIWIFIGHAGGYLLTLLVLEIIRTQLAKAKQKNIEQQAQ